MKVNLTSTPEFPFDVLREVVLILNQTPGEIEFILGKPLTVNQYSLAHPKFRNIEDAEPFDFDEFFILCDTYRTFKEIPDDEYVVMVTSIRNRKDWFSAFKGKNIFVHGEEWEYYTKKDAKYGISYQVVENIFQSLIELSIDDIDNEENIHCESIGCIDDMCMNKTDVMLKLRTADICSSCLERAEKKNINPLILEHILRIISNLRNEFVFSSRVSSLVKPEMVHIDPVRMVKIGTKSIDLNPLNKVVFIFFLQNLQGVETKLICNYDKDLKKIYKEVRDNPDDDVIDRMIEMKDNNFRTVKARLNKALIEQLGPKLAEYYILIKVEIRDSINKYKINLEEQYITIEPPKRK
jgi:hypothetical protein